MQTFVSAASAPPERRRRTTRAPLKRVPPPRRLSLIEQKSIDIFSRAIKKINRYYCAARKKLCSSCCCLPRAKMSPPQRANYCFTLSVNLLPPFPLPLSAISPHTHAANESCLYKTSGQLLNFSTRNFSLLAGSQPLMSRRATGVPLAARALLVEKTPSCRWQIKGGGKQKSPIEAQWAN